MYQAVIIADDFSSAADCGVQFARYGLVTKAMLDMNSSCLPKAQVLSVDTDSRAVSSREAYFRNKKAAENVKKCGFHRIYKSIDSTLRGNIGAEIEGILDGLGWSFALVAPAFPQYGRVLVNGIHYLNGIPLAESFLQKDPVCPMRESSFLKILQSQLRGKTASIGLSTVRAGRECFLEEMEKLYQMGVTVAAVDTQTEEDLRLTAEYSLYLKDCLVCGSTGLARYLPRSWGLTDDLKKNEGKTQEGPVIVAAASTSPVTRRQIQILEDTNCCTVVKIPPLELVEKRWDKYFEAALGILKEGRNLVICLESQEKETAGTLGVVSLSVKITQELGILVRQLLDQAGAAGIVMTGGDTARGICSSLKGTVMELEGEVESGIPKGRLDGSYKIPIVTKAGAFGTENALVLAVKELGGAGKWKK